MRFLTKIRTGFLLLPLIIVICSPLHSQDLKIRYNYIKDSVDYKNKSGVVIKDSHIKLRKGDHITVEIDDINPYVFYAVVDGKDSAVVPITAVLGNLSSAMSGIGIKTIPGVPGLLGASPLVASKGVPNTYGLRGKALRNQIRRNKLNNILGGQQYQLLLKLDTQLTAIKNDAIIIVNFNDTLNNYAHAIDTFIYNQTLSEDTIKKNVDLLAMRILGDSTGDSLKRRAFNNFNRLKEAYYKYLAYMDIYRMTSAQVMDSLKDISKRDSALISDIDSDEQVIDLEVERKSHIYNIQAGLDSVIADSSAILKLMNRCAYAALTKTIDGIVQKKKDLTAVKFIYFKPDMIALKDFKNININIYYKDSTANHAPVLVKTRSFSFMAGHPLYSLPSVGIAFSRMFQQQYTYQNKNSTITATKADAVTPSVDAQFTLATPSKKKYFAYGGTVGVGFSLTDQSLDFMVGPSLLFGDKQKLMITVGIIGGQITKLSGTAKIGDALDAPDAAVPVTKVYSIGYFLGLSYVPKF